MKNNKVNREDVINAYKYLLLRDPESEESIKWHLHAAKNLNDLHTNFIKSEEFNSLWEPDLFIYKTNFLPNEIETDLSEENLKKLLKHIEKVWSGLGETQPYWSVLTDEKYKCNDENIEETDFFESGQKNLEMITNTLKRVNEWDKLNKAKALEYGCGVGRNLIPLSTIFDYAVGIDISTPHLQTCERNFEKKKRTNIDLLKVSNLEDLNIKDKFDFIFSIIVLQHNPPPIIKEILIKLFSLLTVGGIIMFQVPTGHPWYSFNFDKYCKDAYKKENIEMHCIPQHVIFRIANENNCIPLEVHEDYLAHGSNFISQTFVFKKIK